MHPDPHPCPVPAPERTYTPNDPPPTWTDYAGGWLVGAWIALAYVAACALEAL
jgi:hypothetical protein